ncbi:MAG: cytochrome c-550 PedF [Granulosicoccaceae bacterium]
MKLSQCILALPLALAAAQLHAHGNVTPQEVDTSSMPSLGEEWLEENPWRDPSSETWQKAVDLGASAYNQNCARCHGLEVVSGGLAPDLRLLSADYDGDEWYLERYRNGMTQNGITKMPPFGILLGQETAWAIRTYVESRPEDDAFRSAQSRLVEIRAQLEAWSADGADLSGVGEQTEQLKAELLAINDAAKTASGAPKVESAVSRAAMALNGEASGFKTAAEQLTIGMSAAH